MRYTAIALAALLGLAAAPVLAQQTDKSGSAYPDHTAASSNYTGKGDSGAGGSPGDRGPAEDAGNKPGHADGYRQ